MHDDIAKAIMSYADATRALASAIDRLAGAGITTAPDSEVKKAAEPKASRKKAAPAPEPQPQEVAAQVEEAGPQEEPAPIGETEAKEVIAPKVKLSDKKTWTPMSPPEAREKCKLLITSLARAGREQDILRSLDSVDSTRLGDVPDLALASLFVALEVAVQEAGLGE